MLVLAIENTISVLLFTNSKFTVKPTIQKRAYKSDNNGTGYKSAFALESGSAINGTSVEVGFIESVSAA